MTEHKLAIECSLLIEFTIERTQVSNRRLPANRPPRQLSEGWFVEVGPHKSYIIGHV
jgi:hypothetical protein